ncbi:MAG: tRNA uridine-5-carboxymethylaminomethyl(34) synthesis GTPase MnmE [Defluviitaleaceae bacterium]|nr:tRNA uridine-5-carboxymethylaminomethyl(34) synthesis GTPase MnmE [Defluviitaleaceae bacterium]
MLNINQNEDTITAIATAAGQGAIGIVRISGKNAIEVLERVFLPTGKKNRAGRLESHRMYYGEIRCGGEVIDEVMVCVMLGPRSYTREDMVEIYAHGGMLVLGEVLATVVAAGARLADPGEFTKRAFLNGRLNLAQAEAVMDIIGAGSQAARKAGLRQLGGGLSQRIENVRDKILMWLAHIELSIDYPEHDEEARNAAEILAEAGAVQADLAALLETAKIGRIMREGIKTAIIGRPNVGKSTLLNAILSEDRAIVHELPGTTRDVLTEQVRVGDLFLVIMDTAGIRETDDPIEKIGMDKTLQTAEDADLVLLVEDASRELCEEDQEIRLKIHELKIPYITVFNKVDLVDKPPDKIENLAGVNDYEHLAISAKTGLGLDILFRRINELFCVKPVSLETPGAKSSTNLANAYHESDIITRERHRVLIESAIKYVEQAVCELEDAVPEDLVSLNLRAAYMALGEVLGAEIGDDIVDRIFAEFCLGK